MSLADGEAAEYVIVGSGAGGGTLAARLAEAGHRVVVLEAGSDPCSACNDADAKSPEGIPEQYQVPVLHAFASENAAMRWDFFVRHYGDDVQQREDTKYYDEIDGRRVDGVLYPRAGTLGGCTTHNAMLVVYPQNSDWDAIAALTGDASWNAANMRRYFQRVENCGHRPIHRLLSKLGLNPTRHGWSGWLHTEKAIPEAVLEDRSLLDVIRDSIVRGLGHPETWFARLKWFVLSQGDPNDWRLVRENAQGARYVPISTRGGERIGTRERLLETAKRHPNLHIELDALATRVLFDAGMRAVGVEYLKGERLYRAHANPSEREGERRTVRATREVIVAGGAFNTPQLLMLSGIGPREALAAHGIDCRVDAPGVGKNLQDRYEIGVVNRMRFKAWHILKGCTFGKDDPQYAQWRGSPRKGVYTTNGAVLAFIKRSVAAQRVPDLFCFSLLGKFKGYFPGYSLLLREHLNYLTWAILKAHTNNRAGEVTLCSADPRQPPRVNFRYFHEGSDGGDQDLNAVVDGIKFARGLAAPLKAAGLIEKEEEPGEHLQSDEDLQRHVRDNAWGHHASCTCPIGPRDKGGVVDGNFRVHGTARLRVVDASVFPRIPGYFIVSAIYMIAEKAADAILADRETLPPVTGWSAGS